MIDFQLLYVYLVWVLKTRLHEAKNRIYSSTSLILPVENAIDEEILN
jgi:hypothetical protein